MVIPNRHVPWWHDLTEEEIQSLFKSARKVAQKMSKAFEPDLVTMYVRGRRISHTHIFLVPTYSGDVLDSFFNALGSFQESIEEFSLLKNSK